MVSHSIDITMNKSTDQNEQNGHIVALGDMLDTDLINSADSTQTLHSGDLLETSSYEELKTYLADFEIDTVTKYCIVNETKDFSKQVTLSTVLSELTKLPSIRWEMSCENNVLNLPFNGVPFVWLGQQKYHCHQGKDHHANRKLKAREVRNEKMVSDQVLLKTRASFQRTKKLGCPVKFGVRKIFAFPEFCIQKNTKYSRQKAARKLKAKLIAMKETYSSQSASTEPTLGCLKFVTSFPESGHKYHHQGQAAELVEPLDPRVSEHLKKLIRSGTKEIDLLQNRALEFVQEALFSGEKNPSIFRRRRFCPSRRKIMNLILSVKTKAKSSLIDEESLERLKEAWKKWADVYLETRLEQDDIINKQDGNSSFCNYRNENGNASGKDCQFWGLGEQKLVFVYQSREMKRLYRRYGCYLVMLDAVHKTIEYSMPLYFLVVQTNVNYQVAAVIVIQEGTSEMISKALQVVKDWNPDVYPKYGMVDNDTAEICSLAGVFNGIQVFFCDFHRERSWGRWITQIENGVVKIADDVKKRLRKIASAVTVDACLKAVEDFRNWDKLNARMESWFEGTWFPQICRWSLAFRPPDIMMCNTNNGTERLSEDMKYEDLDKYINCSLSEILQTLIERILPKLYERYVELNVQSTSEAKRSNGKSPRSLLDRPATMVREIMRKLDGVSNTMMESVVDLEGNKVSVLSEDTGSNQHCQVDFGDDTNFPSCTCTFFRRSRLLCKHFCAVVKAGLRTFSDLSVLYLKNPLTVLDPDLFTPEYKRTDYSLTGIENDHKDVCNGGDDVSDDDSNNDDGNCDSAASSGQLIELASRQRHLRVAKINLISKCKQLSDLCYLLKNAQQISELNIELQAVINKIKFTMASNASELQNPEPC